MDSNGIIRPRIGITYLPAFAPEDLRAAAVEAEAAGLEEFWLWEDCFKHGGLTTATAALASTQRIAVGIGLLPVPLRNVAITAMELAGLHRMFPGRVIAGIGHGVQSWMGQVGARVTSPMALLEEYHQVLRDLLDGRRVDFKGRYLSLDGVELQWPPSERVPLMLGGEGPKTLRLAARLGDGNLLTALLGDEDIRRACGLIHDELAAAAGDRGGHQIVAHLLAATGEDAEGRIRNEIAQWGKSDVPNVGAAGDARTVADSILRLARMGVTSVAVQPTEDEPDLHGLIRFLGAEVRPLLA
ncbi:LLM class flavin-dependent oxidoreductase [Streptosporangiaceae bacterium NEAU-GS5]|nr:LLM class flavin-dependent oxidoreductase [Streptosporangiaceae bacterium NEAU-GS5]